jgi:hypothetical protein
MILSLTILSVIQLSSSEKGKKIKDKAKTHIYLDSAFDRIRILSNAEVAQEYFYVAKT